MKSCLSVKSVLLYLIFASVLLLKAASPAWVADQKGYLLKFDRGSIACSQRGQLTLSPVEKPSIQVGFFLWHDAWVYETLIKGRIDSSTILPTGELQLKGVWGMSKGLPDLGYTMTLKPEADQVAVTLVVEKSGELSLSRGIWAAVSTPVAAEEGRVVYLYPGSNVPVGKSIEGPFLKTFIGDESGSSIFFSGEGLCSLRSHTGGSSHQFEVKLARKKDFPVGEKMTVLMNLGFADMPVIVRAAVTSNAPLSLSAQAPSKVQLFDKCEIDVALTGSWKNPYDPDQISLDANVTTASGKTYTQPGFFMVAQRSVQQGAVDMMLPCGRGEWKVRLAATESGPLNVTLTARDSSGRVVYKLPHEIMVEAGKRSKGFVRVSEVDPHYLAHDNGEGYVPIGHNVPIYESSNDMSVKDILEKMSAHGENWNRWWMSRSGLGIEWEPKLGWYRQAQSAKLDVLLEDAGRLGMYYMLCMDTHQDFRKDGWKGNPFNTVQGGPCKTVSEWFTNKEAKALYRKRLRYTVARWGYSPHVLCWEFGNEFEGWAGTKQETIIEWHREMSPVLAALDPYDHLITTSWWSKTGPEECWKIPEMEIVQTHSYANNDFNVALETRDYCLTQWNGFQKPHLFAEFGIRSHNFSAEDDPTGRAIHNTMWASIASGCCGATMPWWHKNYIEPKGLYFHFQSIRNFVKDLPFGTAKWRQVAVTLPQLKSQPARPSQRDVVVLTQSGFRKPARNLFEISSDGDVSDAGELLSLLHGRGHGDLVNPPVFEVVYPEDGNFIVHVDKVSNSGLLKIFVDDKLALEQPLPCGEGHGQSWRYVKRWNLWESVYNSDITVPVLAGRHRVRVENHGADWVKVDHYTFSGCRMYEKHDVNCYALASPEVAVLWIQSGDSTWVNHARHKNEIRPFPAAEYILDGFADGDYEVEWWETWKGAVLRKEKVRAEQGVLKLHPGVVATDLAAKIYPAKR
ncbi:MAG: DUF5060 domain-containing protein [Kiritimatiellae bacterium]|jgi:hypothetical protein|nr:DUF5060 domain-containing protein [Kiritimatiellia bacterium]